MKTQLKFYPDGDKAAKLRRQLGSYSAALRNADGVSDVHVNTEDPVKFILMVETEAYWHPGKDQGLLRKLYEQARDLCDDAVSISSW